MTSALTVFKKSTFQKKKNSHLNALGSKFDLDIKVNLGSSIEQTW